MIEEEQQQKQKQNGIHFKVIEEEEKQGYHIF